LFGYPLVLLPVRAALKGLDPAMEEASLTLGLTKRETIRKVVIPALRPAIASGALLTALYALSDVGAVSVLGFNSLSRAIFVSFHALDRKPAVMLSVILAAAALLIVAAEGVARTRFHYHPVHSGGARRTTLIPLGRRRWPAFAGCVVLAGLTLGVPIAAITITLGRLVPSDEPLRLAAAQAVTLLQGLVLAAVAMALLNRPKGTRWFDGAGARLAGSGKRVLVVGAVMLPLGVLATWLVWGIRTGWLVWAVDAPNSFGRASRSIAQTLEASGLGAAVTLAAAWPVAVLVVRRPGRLARLMEKAAFMGYALPGLVVGLSLALFGARLAPALYQTVGMLVFAYGVLFLPLATGALRISMSQVSPALEEAALSLGAGRWRTARRVTGPMIFPGVAAGGALVFLTIMKELPATLLLAPAGFSTLATEVWTAAGEGLFARAALPALALILLACLPLSVLLMDESRHRYALPRRSR